MYAENCATKRFYLFDKQITHEFKNASPIGQTLLITKRIMLYNTAYKKSAEL
jgi:hypothetical protein